DVTELPPPEGEIGEPAQCEPRVAGSLDDVVAGSHQRRSAEREDDTERMVGANPAEGQPRHAEIERRPYHFRRGVYADRHSDDAPDGCREEEKPYDVIVIGLTGTHRQSSPRVECKSALSKKVGR